MSTGGFHLQRHGLLRIALAFRHGDRTVQRHRTGARCKGPGACRGIESAAGQREAVSCSHCTWALDASPDWWWWWWCFTTRANIRTSRVSYKVYDWTSFCVWIIPDVSKQLKITSPPQSHHPNTMLQYVAFFRILLFDFVSPRARPFNEIAPELVRNVPVLAEASKLPPFRVKPLDTVRLSTFQDAPSVPWEL